MRITKYKWVDWVLYPAAYLNGFFWPFSSPFHWWEALGCVVSSVLIGFAFAYIENRIRNDERGLK